MVAIPVLPSGEFDFNKINMIDDIKHQGSTQAYRDEKVGTCALS